jgi:hypothetical protein
VLYYVTISKTRGGLIIKHPMLGARRLTENGKWELERLPFFFLVLINFGFKVGRYGSWHGCESVLSKNSQSAY